MERLITGMPPWSPDHTPETLLQHPGEVECYDCGHRYDYLGEDHHLGRCPSCDARGVTPAGDLHLGSGLESVVAGPGNSTHRVDAVDATDRVFSYWIATLHDTRAQLVRVGVADTLVGPTHDAWPDRLADLVPAWLDDAVADAGLELVAPPAILD